MARQTPTTCESCGRAMITHFLGKRPHLCAQCRIEARSYLPSLEEIAEACRKIQNKWTKDERSKRAGIRASRVETQVVQLPLVRRAR